MSRFLAAVMVVVTLMLAGGGVAAEAETSPKGDGAALRSAATAAKIHAEDQLAKARAAIIDDRVKLAAALQGAERTAAALRVRLREAQRGRDAAAGELRKRAETQEKLLVQVRVLADRAMVAAKLPSDQAKALQRQSPRDRVMAALAAIAARLRTLPEKLTARIADEQVITRRGSLITVPVLRLGQARAIAVGADDDSRGLLTRAGDGASWLVAGALLPAEAIAALGRAGQGRLDLIPLDPDNTLPQQLATHQRTLAEWVKGGRFFIWPIIGLFLLALAVALARVAALARLRVDPRRLLAIAGLIHARREGEAAQLVEPRTTPLDRVLAAGLAALGRPREAREAVLDQALLQEAARLQRGLAFILVVAGVSPLLGLLGTVTGMIDMFGVIAQQGSGNAKSLSGAISEALITTQAGMLAAIPMLLIHAALARAVERRLMLLEEAACGLLGLDPQADATAVAEVAR